MTLRPSSPRVPLRVTVAIGVVAAAVWASAPSAQTPSGGEPGLVRSASTDGDHLFQPTSLHRVHVSIVPTEWAILQTSTANGGMVRGGSDYQTTDGRSIHVGSGFGGVFPWV